MLSVPRGLEDLAKRAAMEGIEGYSTIVLRAGRWIVPVEAGAWYMATDVRCIPEVALRADRVQLTEVLDRIGASGFEVNALLQEEFAYLQSCVGWGNWCTRVPYVV